MASSNKPLIAIIKQRGNNSLKTHISLAIARNSYINTLRADAATFLFRVYQRNRSIDIVINQQTWHQNNMARHNQK